MCTIYCSILELKALHKFMLGYVNAGLMMMDLDDIMHKQLKENMEC